jgi:hypothetical protein
VLAVTDFTREAERLLRDGSTFEWSTVALLGFAIYVYAVEVERRRWDIVLAGLGFWLMDWFNELVNSAVLHATDRAAIWTVTGDTSYLILIGLTVEISLLFLVAGVAFVKQLPERGTRILGLPSRPVLVLAFSCFCVAVELFLNSTGYFHWEYWWWNTPNVVLIVLLGYVPFFAVAAWVFDMGADRRRQLRVVGAIFGVDVALGVALGAAGWL